MWERAWSIFYVGECRPRLRAIPIGPPPSPEPHEPQAVSYAETVGSDWLGITATFSYTDFEYGFFF